MKVIGAGFPKTGTKSLWHAMEILGFKHFDGFSRTAKVDKIYVYDLSIVATSVLVTDVEGLCW